MNATTNAALPLWRPHKKGIFVEMLLSTNALAALDQPDFDLDGFNLQTVILDDTASVASQLIPDAQAIIVEVKKDPRLSAAELAKLMTDMPNLPIIVALEDPSVADVRLLMRHGAVDVLPLPLKAEDLGEALARLRDDLEAKAQYEASRGSLVSIVKSVGGVGATAVLAQLAAEHAVREAKHEREVCLLDLDIQLGSASLYLGSLPLMGMKDLLEAGARADGALLRSVTSAHSSGLHFVAAPADIMPMESVGSDQVISILDLAVQEFDTVFVDLPANWTNWSFSALARSDLILLVAELSIASLRQARRQMDLIAQQGLSNIPLHIIMNRVEKKFFKSIDMHDASRALGHNIAFTVANDFDTMRTALDQGVLVSEISSRSRLAKDIGAIADALPRLAVKVAG